MLQSASLHSSGTSFSFLGAEKLTLYPWISATKLGYVSAIAHSLYLDVLHQISLKQGKFS